eukprot:TRINITY_DN16838_c0_g1_i1.p1 TRINITY_DN16838_c0_g1~~TRINITY_DN16838_c0_g1_i1.p1  ORF type:complete len:856 (+),score=165.65 TRINITY_DN16838_c0_g1_i1:79-2568(+)
MQEGRPDPTKQGRVNFLKQHNDERNKQREKEKVEEKERWDETEMEERERTPRSEDEIEQKQEEEEEQVMDDDEETEVQKQEAQLTEEEKGMMLLPDELTVSSLERTVTKDVTKTRRYRIFPCYLMFLLTFSVLIGVEQLSSDDRFYMTESIRDVTLISTFNDIHTVENWYAWLDTSFRRLWSQQDSNTASTPLNRNVLIGMVVLRQWRAKPVYCSQSPQLHMLSLQAKNFLPRLCYGDYSEGSLDATPYGPNLQWQPSKNINYSLEVVPVTGQLHTYASSSDAFPIFFYVNTSLSSVLQELSVLKTSSWIDSSTRAVVVDLLFYNPNVKAFVLYHHIAEIDTTGDLIPLSKSSYFKFLKYNADKLSGFIFFLDILVFLFTVMLIVDMWCTIKNQYYLYYGSIYQAISFWEIYMTGLIVLLVIRGAYRFWLWTAGTEVGETWIRDHADRYGGDEDKLMFQNACDYVLKQRFVLVVDAWVSILAWLRVFEFLQFNERLNLVTETMIKSIGQLAAMIIIFLIILIGFTIAGRIFYGHAMFEFRSFFATAGYLVRLVFSADLGDYLEMEKIRPIITHLYIPLFFILTWLVLLNMVLAIIAGSFQALQERATKDPRGWMPAELWEDCKKTWNRVLPHRAHMLLARKNNRPPPEDSVQVRLDLLPRLQIMNEAGKKPGETEVFIPKQDFLAEACKVMRPETAERVYNKAAADINGAQEKSFKLGERFAFHLNKRLLVIESQIHGQQGNIDRIPEIEKQSLRKHIINLQPKVDRLNELQDDIRRELFLIHHNLPIHFDEVHQDLNHQMANLEQITSQRVAPPLQELVEKTRNARQL